MASYDHKSWAGKTDGTPWMQRTLIFLLRYIPVEVFYVVVGLVIPFYIIFSHRGRRASWNLFRKRLECSFWESVWSVYLNEFMLGLVVIDRFASFAGVRFEMDTMYYDLDHFNDVASRDEGFVQIISHMGNPEMAGYMYHTSKPMNVLVFPGETQSMMEGRARMFGSSNIRMVRVSEDLSHLFDLSSALDNGEIVTMPADRPYGSSKTARITFLGSPAEFPVGPFKLAQARGVKMYMLFVFKTGRRKYFTWFLNVHGDTVEKRMNHYTGQLEAMLRAYPHQWFNFYDFWK